MTSTLSVKGIISVFNDLDKLPIPKSLDTIIPSCNARQFLVLKDLGQLNLDSLPNILVLHSGNKTIVFGVHDDICIPILHIMWYWFQVSRKQDYEVIQHNHLKQSYAKGPKVTLLIHTLQLPIQGGRTHLTHNLHLNVLVV